MKLLETILDYGGTRRDIAFLILSGAALLCSMFHLPFPAGIDPAWVAILLCGVPIILEAVIGLVTAFDIKADVLVSIALIASVIIGEDFAAGEVAFIMQLGGLLEELTVARARAGIERLVHLTPRTARVIDGGAEKIIPAGEVKVGERLRVLPGETVPVDGRVVSGQTSVNQAVMTGESLPVDKGPGDEVSSGTVNQFGSFDMEATRVGEDSSIQRMIRLVQSADAGKAKIVGLADRWATWIVVIALSAAALTWLVTGEIIRAVTILVVFCPCALVLATPTAIMAAIGNATHHGFLVREGDALERLASAGAYDVLGHIIYPLRYMPFPISLERWRDRIRGILETVVSKGKGIEVNTYRGRTLGPWLEILTLYHACGGEIVTLGSDAHIPAHVGAGIPQAAELLRAAGFSCVAVYQRRIPHFQPI